MPVWRAVLARTLCDAGRTEDARRHRQMLGSDNFEGIPRDMFWLMATALLAEVATILGDAARAATLHRLLLPFADRHVNQGDVGLGSASRILGGLAATVGDLDRAARDFEDALAHHVAWSARPWTAHTQHECARALLARDGPGDRARAGELLDAAAATARELDMTVLEGRLAELVPA